MKTSLLKIAAVCAVGFLTSLAARAADGWSDNYEKALATAKAEKKLVLADFTGSDWCGWCIKMKKETFSEKAFKDYAEKNLVLVEVDFPKHKRLPATLAKQNDALMTKYGVESYPTYIITDPDGREIGRQPEYLKGGPVAFIDKVESIKAKAKAR